MYDETEQRRIKALEVQAREAELQTRIARDQDDAIRTQTGVLQQQADLENKKLPCDYCGRMTLDGVKQGKNGCYCGLKCMKSAGDTKPDNPAGEGGAYVWDPLAYSAYIGDVGRVKMLVSKGWADEMFSNPHPLYRHFEDVPLVLALANGQERAALELLHHVEKEEFENGYFNHREPEGWDNWITLVKRLTDVARASGLDAVVRLLNKWKDEGESAKMELVAAAKLAEDRAQKDNKEQEEREKDNRRWALEFNVIRAYLPFCFAIGAWYYFKAESSPVASIREFIRANFNRGDLLTGDVLMIVVGIVCVSIYWFKVLCDPCPGSNKLIRRTMVVLASVYLFCGAWCIGKWVIPGIFAILWMMGEGIVTRFRS
jgi:hypothetical protein